MAIDKLAEAFERITKEMQAERASALRRISSTLESLIAEMQAIRARLASLDEPDRARALHDYAELRRQALRYRWYLEVQREALGLYQHHRLDEFYAIPEPLD
jgi:hypothetical protein